MQIDMHYYGTFVLARAAGINEQTAQVIATASQFVDDSVENNTDCVLKDGSKIRQIVTAHHTDSISNINRDDQRYVWIPFHFLPGGEGKAFYEKLVCRMNSPIVQEMKDHALLCSGKHFAAELIGITAHVYADTFSHYGFSGISSHVNRVDNDSIKLEVKDKGIFDYIKKKSDSFYAKFKNTIIMHGLLPVISAAGEELSGALGHGAVATFPDRPYLKWKFKYEKGPDSERDNRITYLDGCRSLFDMFKKFASSVPAIRDNNININTFDDISTAVAEILSFEGKENSRIEKWQTYYKSRTEFNANVDGIPAYSGNIWLKEIEKLCNSNPIDLSSYNAYNFYQAAEFHRTYVLRELLPSHGIFVI